MQRLFELSLLDVRYEQGAKGRGGNHGDSNTAFDKLPEIEPGDVNGVCGGANARHSNCRGDDHHDGKTEDGSKKDFWTQPEFCLPNDNNGNDEN